MLRSRLLLNTMLFGLAGSLVIQVVDFQFTSLFRVFAPDRESLLGWMVAATGAGAVLIILILNKLKLEEGYGWKLGSGYVLIGGSIAALGLLQPGGIYDLGAADRVCAGDRQRGIHDYLQLLSAKKRNPAAHDRPYLRHSEHSPQHGTHCGTFAGWSACAICRSGPYFFVNIGLLQLLLGLTGVVFGRQLWPVARSTAEAAHPAVESS
ncbi:hypothetical protein ACFTAO_05350 [Paenibacillus rhizoplanae]